MTETNPTQSVVNRRGFLRVAAASVIGMSGCIQRVQDARMHDQRTAVSLTIKTTPADDDPYAIRIAQRLAANLDSVGIRVEVVPIRSDQLLRNVLIDHEFELYVTSHHGGTDPDFLYSLLHSRYDTESGWQNPFGFDDQLTDELLERQRQQSGKRRQQTAVDLQRTIATEQPFTVIAAPDMIRAVRRSHADRWQKAEGTGFFQALGVPSFDRETGPSQAGQTGSSRSVEDSSVLRIALTDERVTKNLNPIAVQYRDRGLVTDLLYDPLVVRHREEYLPWFASAWDWVRPSVRPVLDVQLRDDLLWHDGRPITTDDVAFTYRFLGDTSLGANDHPIPAPRFQGRLSLIAETQPVDDRRIRIAFQPVHPHVAISALTIPLFPEHVWRSRSGPAQIAGVEFSDGITEAMAWSNMEPVGSGPMMVTRVTEDESLILDRFEDHFAWHGTSGIPDHVLAEPSFERLAIRIVPSDESALDLLGANEVDATGTTVHSRVVPDAVRSDDIRLIVRPSHAFYHIGFNTRDGPLGTPAFRRAVARLVNKSEITTDIFDGYATPIASPIVHDTWLAPELTWTGRDPVTPFAGDIEGLNVEQARHHFREAGYRYDSSGRLLRR